MTLVCSNPDCKSHKDDSAMFTINATVGPDRELSVELEWVGPAQFKCVYCGSEATETEGGAK